MNKKQSLPLPSSAYPVLGKNFSIDQYIPLDLSSTYERSDGNDPISHLQHILELSYQKNPQSIPYGGYMERRGIYMSDHFGTNNKRRCVHLGVDLWTKADTPIFAPFDGEVHSYKYNPAKLDYGYTIILAHNIDNVKFFTLYGHLSDYNFDKLYEGQNILRGHSFCQLGSVNHNGGWPPHLHFQIILNMNEYKGDFPGVSTEAEAEKYSHLCPDPTHIALGYNSKYK